MSKKHIKDMDVHVFVGEDGIKKFEGTIYGDCYIIPNPPIKISSLFDYNIYILEDFVVRNKLHFDFGYEGCIQLYYVTKNNDKLGDQTLQYNDEKTGINISFSPYINYLPASMFQGKKEGDIIEFDYYDEIPYEHGESIHATLHFVFQLAQTKYRFRGNFEEILKKIINE
jgi:hypothetical protein